MLFSPVIMRFVSAGSSNYKLKTKFHVQIMARNPAPAYTGASNVIGVMVPVQDAVRDQAFFLVYV